MIDAYLIARFLHILGATVLFGTGLGIAFFMFAAHRTGETAIIAGVARLVVRADFLFTALAVLVQPLTGLWLVHLSGHFLTDGWILISLALYLFTGALWLPVVWLQIRIRDMAMAALAGGTPLPARYDTFMRIWFWMGWPAFGAVLLIFYLMIAKPALI